jgi:hypothetical protein
MGPAKAQMVGASWNNEMMWFMHFMAVILPGALRLILDTLILKPLSANSGLVSHKRLHRAFKRCLARSLWSCEFHSRPLDMYRLYTLVWHGLVR